MTTSDAASPSSTNAWERVAELMRLTQLSPSALADGFASDGIKVQFSFKYNFSYKLGG